MVGVPNTLKSLGVTYRGSSSAPCTQTLSAWNWTLGIWSSLGTKTLGTTETETVATVGGNLADYVSNTTGTGDVAIRFGCSGGTFTSSTDLLRISYTP
jgi:hypothetical protein